MTESSSAADDSIGVLICDDVESMRFLLRLTIELHEGERGLRVIGEARDGNEAIAEAERLQPDVIVLDLSMPHRTGLDALPEIKHVAPDAKIIVLSAFASSTIAADVLAHGADRYMEKGAAPSAISGAIEEVAARAHAGQPQNLSPAA